MVSALDYRVRGLWFDPRDRPGKVWCTNCVLYQVIQPIIDSTPACHMARGEHVSIRVICRDDMNTVRHPSERDVRRMPSVQNRTSVTCRLILQNTRVYNVHIR